MFRCSSRKNKNKKYILDPIKTHYECYSAYDLLERILCLGSFFFTINSLNKFLRSFPLRVWSRQGRNLNYFHTNGIQWTGGEKDEEKSQAKQKVDTNPCALVLMFVRDFFFFSLRSSLLISRLFIWFLLVFFRSMDKKSFSECDCTSCGEPLQCDLSR